MEPPSAAAVPAASPGRAAPADRAGRGESDGDAHREPARQEDAGHAPGNGDASRSAVPDEVTGRLADQLLGLSRRLHRAQRRLMEPLGVTPAQGRLLRSLAHCPEPPRMADLAQRLDVVPRAVTTLVDALEAAELVRRVPDPRNRRVIRVELRERGQDVLRELRQARRTAAADLLAPLDADQRAALTALLTVLEPDEGPRPGV